MILSNSTHPPMPHLQSILQEIKDLHGLKAFEGSAFLGMLKDLCPDLEKPIYFVLKQVVADQVPQRFFALRKETLAVRKIELERIRQAFVRDNCLDQKAYEVFDLLSEVYFSTATLGQPSNTNGDFYETVNGVTFKMIAVRGGTFTMGDLFGEGEDHETPHEVTLDSYFLGETPVTQELWVALMGDNPSHFKGDDELPVEQVSWFDCQEFIAKLNELTGKKFRLPTESEWEFAARERGRKVRFGNGKDIADPDEMNFDASDYSKRVYTIVGQFRRKTTPMKTFKPNALGLYDMTGNVFEWCADWWGRYDLEHHKNPIGPSIGSSRVHRGGSYGSIPEGCRVSYRSFANLPYSNYHFLGFRLASQ
jgi:formylglycine-generating enzyme required for sulfatase activity